MLERRRGIRSHCERTTSKLLAVLQAFGVIAAVIAVGVVVGRRGVLGENAQTTLNRTAFHIGVPALLLITLADAAPQQVFSLSLLVSAIAALIVFAIYFLIAATVLRRPRGEATIGAAASSYVNAGNLGLPLSTYVLGSTTEVSAIILFQVVVLAPLAFAILDSERAEHRSVGRRIRALISNPIIAASAVGLALAATGVELPPMLHDSLELLSALAIPTVLLAFGISLSAGASPVPRSGRAEVALVVVFKTLLMPAVAYCVARWGFGADHHQVLVVTVLAALPSAQNLNTYAAVYHRGEVLARDTTLITTLISFPVLVVIAALTA